jgi:serine/threonine protein kinase
MSGPSPTVSSSIFALGLTVHQTFFARKIIRPHSDIEDERNAATKLKDSPHKNIVKILDYDFDDKSRSGKYYINMEFCEFNLHEYVKGSVDTKTARLLDWPMSDHGSKMQYLLSDIMNDIINALICLHERGLVHRDLSLDNGTFLGGAVHLTDAL